jgi:hypothetical protein
MSDATIIQPRPSAHHREGCAKINCPITLSAMTMGSYQVGTQAIWASGALGSRRDM